MNGAETCRDLLQIREVTERYNVSIRTLNRWIEHAPYEFPAPMMLGGTRYWRRSDLEVWENTRPTCSPRKGTFAGRANAA